MLIVYESRKCAQAVQGGHRVGRVLSLFSSRQNRDSPNHSPVGECTLSPRFGGKGHTRWRERGWESPNSDEGTYTVVLFIYTSVLCEGGLLKICRAASLAVTWEWTAPINTVCMVQHYVWYHRLSPPSVLRSATSQARLHGVLGRESMYVGQWAYPPRVKGEACS
jgi:hypothetical protein